MIKKGFSKLIIHTKTSEKDTKESIAASMNEFKPKVKKSRCKKNRNKFVTPIKKTALSETVSDKGKVFLSNIKHIKLNDSAEITQSCSGESLCNFQFKKGLKALPVATVSEKLNFPMKFDRDAFCIDFSSINSPSSESELTSTKFKRCKRIQKS